MNTPDSSRPGSVSASADAQSAGEESPPQSHAHRIAALSALAAATRRNAENDPAEGGEHSQAARTVAAEDASALRRPVWLRPQVWLALAVLLAGASGAIWRLHTLTPAGNTSRLTIPVQIDMGAGQMYCPRDMAFAPQGNRLAVLGYEFPCVNPNRTYASDVLSPPAQYSPLFYTGSAGTGKSGDAPGLVNIYDTQRGILLGQLHPSAAIKPHIPQPPAAVLDWLAAGGQTLDFLEGINYTHLLWSPDGQRLALTFEVFVPSAPGGHELPGQSFDGVLLTDIGGASPQVFLHPINRARPAATIWDQSNGTALALPPDLASPSVFASVPPAQTYTWSADGAPHAHSPFLIPPASSTLPLDPVDIPEGGETFAPWQAGVVAARIPSTGAVGQRDLTGFGTFAMDTAAWSSDGHLLAQRVGMMGLLVSPQSPALDAATLAAYGWAQAPQLPVRDAGLQQARELARTNSFLSAGGVLVAWRPDGKQIAVDADRPDHAVIIFDCATSKLLASLLPGLQGRSGNLIQGFVNMLRWSHDGSHLALYDTTVDLMTIWNTPQLPH